MISSVVYKPSSLLLGERSTFKATKSPLLQIITAKIAVLIALFLLGELCTQQVACVFVTVGSSLEFWMTKNIGRKYLQAAWSIDTSTEQDIWVYEASFKSPLSLQDVFWYSQIIYGGCLIFSAVIILVSGKYSLFCAVVIAFAANYVNFFAYSRIIEMRNAGIFDQIAQEAQAEGELRQTIKLPLVHRSNFQSQRKIMQQVRKSSLV